MAQLRLILLGITVIAFLALVGTALWYRGQAIGARADALQARADLSTAVAANKAQEAAIGRLRASATLNDKILTKMADDIAGIHSTAEATNTEIGKLRDANEDVRAYLAGRVPASIDRLLNK